MVRNLRTQTPYIRPGEIIPQSYNTTKSRAVMEHQLCHSPNFLDTQEPHSPARVLFAYGRPDACNGNAAKAANCPARIRCTGEGDEGREREGVKKMPSIR